MMLHHQGQASDRSPAAVGAVACRALAAARLPCLAGPWISSSTSSSTGSVSTTVRRLVVAAARSRTRVKRQPPPDPEGEEDGATSSQGYGADGLPITDAEVEGIADTDQLVPITDAEVEGIAEPGGPGLRWDDEDGGAGAGSVFEDTADDDEEDRLLRDRLRPRANRRGRPSKADMLAQEEARTRAGASEGGGYGVGVGPEIEEAIATYDSMFEEDIELPAEMQPEDDAQEARLRFGLACEAYLVRKATREQFTDYGFQAQSEQARRSYNKYANVHAVAALVTEIENVDHAMGPRGYHYLNSWGRAEVLFMRDYFDDFNEYVRENAQNLVKQWPHEEQEEQFDMVDEAVLLPDFSDTRMAPPGDADVEAELAASCLARMLPGLDLDTLSQGDLADDIFDAAIDYDGLDENDVVAMQDKEEGKDVEDESTGAAKAATAASGKRGRKKAADTTVEAADEESGDAEE